MKASYEAIRKELEVFLPTIGEKIMELRRNAEHDPNFARLKADKTIVTKADELSEDIIRSWIIERFPDDTICGEEREERQGGSRMWIIDPIDGTWNFNHFGHQFGVSVGLADSSGPKVGVIHYAAEGVTLSASQGSGARMNGQLLLRQESQTDLKKAVIIAQSRKLHAEYFARPQFAKEMQKEARLTLSEPKKEGSNWSFTFAFLEFLMDNLADAILHPGATPYDIGAICAIAKELQWPVSGYVGEPIDFSRDCIPIVISKNAQLHYEIIGTLEEHP